EIRFSLAKDYLRSTNFKLDQIAELLGYSEPGNFTHAFKRWSGISPRAFRMQSF
ncbi:MAG: AraC family transcriptional regulator, partial [Gammaproteobacteria bacterium]